MHTGNVQTEHSYTDCLAMLIDAQFRREYEIMP